MLACEPLDGLRVVANPPALEAANWLAAAGTDPIVLRIAADEALGIGVVDVLVDDPHAIVELETAFVGWRLTPAEFATHVERHVEWPLPTDRPVLGQGLVAGLPPAWQAMRLRIADALGRGE